MYSKIVFIYLLYSIILLKVTNSKHLMNTRTIWHKSNHINLITKRKEVKLSKHEMKSNELDRQLRLFFNFVKKIETLAYQKNVNKNIYLMEFMDLHDHVLSLFNKDTPLDKKMIHILLNLLDNRIKKNQIKVVSSGIKPFRWG